MEHVIAEAGEALLELLAGGSVIFMFAKLLDYAASF